MIPPTDATVFTPAPVNDMTLLEGFVAAPVPVAIAAVVGAAAPAAPDEGNGAAVVAGAAKLMTTAVLEVASAAAEAVASVAVLARAAAEVAGPADAAQAHTALADCWIARPVTAPHPFTTHSRAALLMAAVEWLRQEMQCIRKDRKSLH